VPLCARACCLGCGTDISPHAHVVFLRLGSIRPHSLRDRVNGQVYNSDGALTETIGCAFDHLLDTSDDMTRCSELARDLNLLVDSTIDGSFPACGITSAPTIAPNDPNGIPSTGEGSTAGAAVGGASIISAIIVCLALVILAVAVVVRRARQSKDDADEENPSSSIVENHVYATSGDVGGGCSRTLTLNRGKTVPAPAPAPDGEVYYETCGSTVAKDDTAENPGFYDFGVPSTNEGLYAAAVGEDMSGGTAVNPSLYDTPPSPAGSNPNHDSNGADYSMFQSDNKAGYLDCETAEDEPDAVVDHIEPLYTDGNDADAFGESADDATSVEPRGLIRKESWRAMLTDSRRASMSSTRSGSLSQ
jgi:hypothetical protein